MLQMVTEYHRVNKTDTILVVPYHYLYIIKELGNRDTDFSDSFNYMLVEITVSSQIMTFFPIWFSDKRLNYPQ